MDNPEQYYRVRHILLDWIDLGKLDFAFLSRNSNALDLLVYNADKIDNGNFSTNVNPHVIHILTNNPDMIDWYHLSGNPNAIDLINDKLNEDPDSTDINWGMLSANPNAFDILYVFQEKILWHQLVRNINPKVIEYIIKPNILNANMEDYWYALSGNSGAIELLKKYPENIDWELMSINSAAIELLTDKIDKNPNTRIDWELLSENPNAIEILDKHRNKIDWAGLSSNPNAIPILTDNVGKIDWDNLSANPNAIELLRENQHRINWKALSTNPSIFVKDKLIDDFF